MAPSSIRRRTPGALLRRSTSTALTTMLVLAGALVPSGVAVADTAAPARTQPVAPAVADAAAAAVDVPLPPPTGTIPPVLDRTAATVTADALPTVQINGVVWKTAIAGNIVFAGGKFTSARPAGAPAGTNETPRNNLLAFDVRTGNLITSFAPDLDGEVRDVALSPDGSVLYVAGIFSTANGQPRRGLAAYSVATGQLTSFDAKLNGSAYAVAATDSVVYAAGTFSAIRNTARTRLGAVAAGTGNLLAWAPTTDQAPSAMRLTPDKSRLILGGRFTTVNTAPAYGIASIDAVTADLIPFEMNTIVRNAGTAAATVSISVDSDTVYGTSYNYGGGNFEGTWAADPTTGAVRWLDDCHGDTYDTFSADNGVVYNVGHAHHCVNIGGFDETNPRSWYRAMAYSKAVGGQVRTNTQGGSGYGDFGGQPAPSIVNWFPDLRAGTFTGQTQAGWALTGNQTYLVAGGEFPAVNGVAQQGLVRFAISSAGPNKVGPVISGTQLPIPTAKWVGRGVRLNFPANWDRDDLALTYSVFRNDRGSTPVGRVTAESVHWIRPNLSVLDTDVVPGASYTYRIQSADRNGNVNNYRTVSITVPADAGLSPYAQAVLDDGAGDYWRLGDLTAGGVSSNWAGSDDLQAQAGTSATTPGAVNSDSDGAGVFSGSSTGTAGTTAARPAPDTFTVEAWFRTTSRSGGKIVGFGSSSSGGSGSYDRHVYLDNSGRINFGVYPGAIRVVTTPASYNDGQWHHVVATLGPDGMVLYVDGQPKAARTDTTSGQQFSGFWRIGGDNLGSWTNAPSSAYLNGVIDEVAVYPKVLDRAIVREHYRLAGYTLAAPPAPSDAYGAALRTADPDLYWRLDDAAGSTQAADSGLNGQPGTVRGGVSFGSAGAPILGMNSTAATFNGTSGYLVGPAQTAPNRYTLMLWLRTTSRTGGKILGFGNASSNNSSTFDRDLVLLADGRIAFVTNATALATAMSTKSYNDGSWHQVVATQGDDGMRLYVDGVLVGTNPATSAKAINLGYWRVGYDKIAGGLPSQPTKNYFAGAIDELAIFPSAIDGQQVASWYTLATGSVPATPPSAVFTATMSADTVTVDGSGSTDPNGPIEQYQWDFGDGTTATGATASHRYAFGGTHEITLTVTQGGDAGSTTRRVSTNDSYTDLINADSPTLFWRLAEGPGASTAVDSGAQATDGSYSPGVTTGAPGLRTGQLAASFNGTSGTVVSSKQIVSPTTFSVETWLRSTSTTGGRILGFGDAATGLSSQYDRHLWLQPDGRVSFGVWNQQGFTITSPAAINDGGWHHVVGTFGPAGSKLYVDGQLADANPAATASTYSGYWRLGGDNTWSGSPYFAGTLNDAAVYPAELPIATIRQHYAVATGTAPDAVFTATTDGLSASLDARASVAKAGRSLTDYHWDFGDGTTGSGALAQHAYAVGGTYSVVLTVTDSIGLSSSVSHSVQVHQPPTASFTATAESLAVQLDAAGSAAHDDATITSYHWDFGDGSAAGSGVRPAVHRYAAAGTYAVVLTVTDSSGASASHTEQVVVVHDDPVARITSTSELLTVSFDGSTSTAADGATLSYHWDFGDGSAASTEKSPQHSYAAAGTYPVTLTVTDSLGGSHSATVQLKVAANQPPTAAFTAQLTNLTANFDGSSSADADGTIAGYQWDFGDGSAGSTQAQPSHVYAAPGTYTVSLTVTDNAGATGVTTKQVVAQGIPVFAQDNFTRDLTSAWGTAEVGGAWAVSGGAAAFAVTGGQGQITLPTAGSQRTAMQNSVSFTDGTIDLVTSLDKAATGSGYQAIVLMRRASNNDYRLKVRYLATNRITLTVSRVVANAETGLVAVTVPVVTFTPGTLYRISINVSSANGRTTIQAKLAPADQAPPTAWQVTATDATPALQAAGAVGVSAYAWGDVTSAPATFRFDEWLVKGAE